MSWKQTSGPGYFAQSDDGTPVPRSTPGFFAQGTAGTVPTSTPGSWGLGGTKGKGYFGQGGNEPNNPGYFGQGNR